jgi:hypothetical protein
VADFLPEDAIDWQGARSKATPIKTKRAPRRTLAQVEAVFQKWIRGADPIPTRAMLAAYAANHAATGDPVWLMLVGGSGIGKTENLCALSQCPDVVFESTISGPAALLSGTGKKERAKDASGGVLRKFTNGHGVLVLKDFTTILEMHREARAELLAAFREIYDGRWDRSVGADGGRTLTWKGRIGLITGCTTAIDSAHTVLSAMGTRFLLVRLTEGRDLATSVLSHVGRETDMRQELGDAAVALLAEPPGKELALDAGIRQALSALGPYVARARSPVDRDYQGEIALVGDPEAPTRIVKGLARIYGACGLLGLERDDAWQVVRRVGLDSIPKLRRAVLTWVSRCASAATTTEIAEAVDHPTRTTRRALEDLTAHGVIERIPEGPGKADEWQLSATADGWYQLINPETLPDLSEPTHSSSTNKKLKKDITGKVGGRKTGPRTTTADGDGSF